MNREEPMKPITLSEREAIIAVVPEYCAGPGWSNALIWVHICDYATNTLRSEAIQPREQTPEQRALFDVAAAAHQAMLRTIRHHSRPREET